MVLSLHPAALEGCIGALPPARVLCLTPGRLSFFAPLLTPSWLPPQPTNPPPQFILGNTGFREASISHQPSNAEFVMRSVRSVGNLLRAGSCVSGNGNGGSRRGSGAWSSGVSPALSPTLTPRDATVAEAGEEEEGAAAAAAAGEQQADGG